MSLIQIDDVPVTLRHLVFRNRAEDSQRAYVIDSLFPQRLEGNTDLKAVDEGTAALLYGLVRALQPRVVLETGTHKGRSTKSIASALHDNGVLEIMPLAYKLNTGEGGHLYTIDKDDYGLMRSGALTEEEKSFVTQVVGKTPDVYAQPPLDTLEKIDFAFLDGDHTPDGLDADMEYVRLRKAPECVVAVDNARDPGWGGIKRYFHGYKKYPHISLPTCTGLEIIWMKD